MIVNLHLHYVCDINENYPRMVFFIINKLGVALVKGVFLYDEAMRASLFHYLISMDLWHNFYTASSLDLESNIVF